MVIPQKASKELPYDPDSRHVLPNKNINLPIFTAFQEPETGNHPNVVTDGQSSFDIHNEFYAADVRGRTITNDLTHLYSIHKTGVQYKTMANPCFLLKYKRAECLLKVVEWWNHSLETYHVS